LLPRPIQLEPVVVDIPGVDRIFQHRRNAAGVSVRTIDRLDLTLSGAASVLEFLEIRFGLLACPATGVGANRAAGIFSSTLADSMIGVRGCIHRRGRILPVAVFIDDQYALGGILSLA